MNLIKTTGMYFIGNFASKLLIFFLLPIYTAYLSADEYGVADLLISLLPLFGPIFTFQVTESVFRFLFDKKSIAEKKTCISSSLCIFVVGVAFFIIFFLMINAIFSIPYKEVFIFYFISTYLGTFFQQVARGFGYSGAYAISGALSTAISAGLNVVLIVGLSFQGDALLIAAGISSVFICFFLSARIKAWRYISVKSIKKTEVINQIKFSLPLIPNQISWWALGLFGKYILMFFHGSELVGILAFANIFPNAITMVFQIFFLAWVENSIRSYQEKKNWNQFAEMFSVVVPIIFGLSMVLLPVVGIYSTLTINHDYLIGLIFVPGLILASVFNCFATFLGSAYTVLKKTNSAFTTTVVAAIVNVIISIFTIPYFGLVGYMITNVACYIALYIVRIVSVRKLMGRNISSIKVALGTVIFILYSFVFIEGNSIFVYAGLLIAGVFLMILLNRTLILKIISEKKARKEQNQDS